MDKGQGNGQKGEVGKRRVGGRKDCDTRGRLMADLARGKWRARDDRADEKIKEEEGPAVGLSRGRVARMKTIEIEVEGGQRQVSTTAGS